MESSSINQRASTNLIGEKARDILTSSSRGKILASFSRAIYLSSSRNELVWLIGEGGPMHRRGVQLWGVLPGPAASSTYRVSDGTLELEGGYRLDLNQREVWKPESIRTERRLHASEISRTLFKAMTSHKDLSSPKGFGCILPEIAHITGGGPEKYEFCPESPVLHVAWPIVSDIISAISLQDYAQVLPAAARLIGLGEGLTPSGDDFVGGLFFTWKTLTEGINKCSAFKQSDLDLFLAYAKDNTNIISYTILADHVHGWGSETLHRLVNALLIGEPIERLIDLMVRLISLGHSTGWDILAGVLTGMLSCVREKPVMEFQVA